ncbi:hypothetical protein SAMN02799636_04285 [Methylobacterium sp. 275MFSha3.1]|uniref:hypothetical protein n=1 Tax=Methylobacterium sp. 275MFSha3.1 TaxID=1502746 RepID=UPI0008A78EF8|nr:hypothetical protein [Methylobacterium sp. 275MFSha3.1]SEH88651.1 hypothetical protein SAMN02799636_04285 [Methylobacterium sp. 275MFSha3.1]
MDPSQIEAWAFSRSDAAELTGVSSAQIGNFVSKYDLFPGRPKGQGFHISFRLRELMKLAAAQAMVDLSLRPEQAAAALRGIQGPYGAMLHDGWSPLGHGPGTIPFTRDADGRWIAGDSPENVASIHIRAWPIFDDLWPRIRAKILEEGKAEPAPYPGDVEAGIAAFEAEIAKIRAQRWGKEA